MKCYIDEQLKNILRKARNKAVHENYEKPCGLLLELPMCLVSGLCKLMEIIDMNINQFRFA